MSKPFYFMRHGETDWNKNRITMGQKDIPLNETGILQAHAAAKVLQKEPIKHIVTSPLLRARVTAEIVSRELCAEMTIIEDLKECAWGALEGCLKEDDFSKKWLSGEICDLAESFESLVVRISGAFSQILAFDAPVLIVAHGGAYLALQKHLGIDSVRIKNCAPMYHAPHDYGCRWETRFL